jgi:hypothetical protein
MDLYMLTLVPRDISRNSLVIICDNVVLRQRSAHLCGEIGQADKQLGIVTWNCHMKEIPPVDSQIGASQN